MRRISKWSLRWMFLALLGAVALVVIGCGAKAPTPAEAPTPVVVVKEVVKTVEVEKPVVVVKEVVRTVEVEKPVVVEKVVEKVVVKEVVVAPAQILKGKTIKIGFSNPLTGGTAFVGLGGKNAIQLRADEVNSAGGILGAKVVYEILDHESRPALGAAHAERFCANKDVIAIIGFANSEVTLAGAPVAAECGLAVVPEVSTNPNITLKNPGTTFRVAGRDDRQGPLGAILSYTHLGFRKQVVIDDQSAFGRAAADAYEAVFKGMGGQVLKREAIRRGDKDVRAAIRAMPAEIDSVYYCGLAPDAAVWVQQMRELGNLKPLVGCDGVYSVQDYITASAGAALAGGGSYMALGEAPPLKASAAFEEAYIAKYGPLPLLVRLYYDAARVTIDAIERAALKSGAVPTRAQVVEALRDTKDLISVSFGTPIRFNKIGDNTGAIYSAFKAEGNPDRFDYFGVTMADSEITAIMSSVGVNPN